MHGSEATPIKRLKTLTQFPNSKGKSVVDGELSTDCCGICLSENGGGIVSRGFIDSCDHFFCFICIMEWSKVESKCPLCKRRFSTVRRPAKPSVFESERVVRVPVRDQVHYYFGNSTVGPQDPYSEVICSVCHGKEDEHLLLLCDLCDSGSHTYCVGLGMTVPDGDWFCVECQILRDEHSKSEIDTSPGERQSNSAKEDGCSISDIVRDPTLLAAKRVRRLSADSWNVPRLCLASRESSTSNNTTNSRIQDSDGKCQTKSNARTLLHCRNLQDRIRLLRENWNGLRSGALHFSWGSGDTSSQGPINRKGGESSSTPTNQRSKFQSDSSSKMAGDKGIQKAWKLLDKAKSMSPVSGKTSNCLVRKLSTPINHESVRRTTFPLETSRCESSAMGRKLSSNILQATVYGRSCSSVERELDSLKAVKSHSYLLDHENSFISDEKLTIEVPYNCPDIEDNGNSSSSSYYKGKHPKEKGKLGKACINHQRYEDAKSEVQSLVKLNLKLLTKEEKLGFDAFKEVARTATHWVLAACKMERPISDSSIQNGLLCLHSSEFGQPQTQNSSLMPDCCRKCFYNFVKDAVNTALLRSKTRQK